MSYKIYHSNNLQEFINRYSDLFHTENLFGEKVVTVVQNKNIASWLRLELTKKDGISMDLNFEYPENAIKSFVLGYPTGQKLLANQENPKTILFMDSLKIVVYKTLEELLINDKIFPHLFHYVDGSSQKLFQLSDSIAGLFYHYGMNCPLMVAAWDKKELYINNQNIIQRESDQIWQMTLWNYIFNDNSSFLNISNLLNSVLNSNESFNSELSPYGPCRIILFGSSFLGESAIKFFNYLSRDIEVHHFILTPSTIYAHENEVEPLSLLSRFSGLISGFTTISRDSLFIKERELFFKDFTDGSLLSNIKDGIKNNSFKESKVDNPIPINIEDNSLKICKVTGGWREIEVLKDKILDLLNKDDGLKLTDIGVVAPEIDDYSSYIEGVFPDIKYLDDGTIIHGKTDLPYNIMGLKGGVDSPFIRGVLALLELPGSDFNRKDILNIISNPCLMEKFSITNNDRDLFIETIDQLNIKWGLDSKHRVDLGYASDNFNTWESGFKRFLLGIALNKEDHELIPYNLSDSQGIDSLGDLIHIIRSLYSDLWNLNKYKLNIDEWVFFIETVMDTYLKPVKDDLYDEKERLAVKSQFRNILNLLDDLKNLSNFKSQEVPFAVFKSLLKEFIIKSGNNRGRYLTQGITFSSLKPLRAVPFKHIFVLGLNEDLFPGKEKIPSYDLRGIYDQKIDLSKRQNDKFAFLELLLSAENSLTLFYNGKNQVSGEALQPSVVINELLEAIDINFETNEEILKHIKEEHPLHNFDPKYFDKESNLISYNKKAYNSAIVYNGDKSDPITIKLNEDRMELKEIEVTVNELIQFIKNPVKNFFNRSEGIYLDEKVSIEEDIYENRDLDFIPKWKLVNLAVEIGLHEDIPLLPLSQKFFENAEIQGVFKGSKLTNNIKEEVENLILDVDSFLTNNNLKGTDFKRVNRELDGEYNPIYMDIDGIKVTLGGELENLWVNENGDCFTTNISLGNNKEFKTKDKILPYIYSLIIFNHKQMSEKSLLAYSIGKEIIEPTEFKNIDDGIINLKNLLSLYIKNRVDPIPLFPDIMVDSTIEGVASAWEKSSNNLMGYSPIKECPYVQLAYNGEIPNFNQDEVELMFSSLYKEIISKKVKND